MITLEAPIEAPSEATRIAPMRSKIVRIGNSRGIRIPKALIEQTGLTGDIEISVEENRLVIAPARRPRSGWSERFESMVARGDDRLLDGPLPPTRFDEDDWEW